MDKMLSVSLRLTRILVCIILSTLSIVGTKGVWSMKGTEVFVEFLSQKDLELQIFYCTETDKTFTEAHSIRQQVQKGQKKAEIFIPGKSKITKFRLDTGTNPGRFVISKITINGKKSLNLNLKQFATYGVSSYVVDNGKGTVISTLQDPYLVYKGILDVIPGRRIDWLVLITFCVVSYFFASKIVKYLLDFKILGSFPRRDIYFLTVFFILLFLPMLCINDEEISIIENRKLAEKPDFSRIFDEKYNYGNLFETWYSDRFFGRNFLIRLHNVINRGQSKTGNDRVLIGKDGWMFYKRDFNLHDFMNSHPACDADLKQSAAYVSDLKKWCQKNNKGFHFFVAPNKHKVYGEFYRDINKQAPDNMSMVNRFLRQAKASGLDTIYPIAELMEAKKRGYLLYWKHDTHWNARGAYIGYLALMRKINEKYDSYKKIEPNYIACTHYAKDLEAMYPEIAPDDNSLYVEHKVSQGIRKFAEGSKLKDTFTQTTPGKHGKVVVYRDSFTTALVPYLSETFGEVTYIWRYHVIEEDYEKYLKNADIVILETVERYIPQLGKNSFVLE